MGKNAFQTFFKKYDGYAKNVSLSYKRSSSFETSIGGICSILSFTILTYWLAINIWDTFTPPGKYSTSESLKLLQTDDSVYPETKIPIDRLFSTYTITSSSSDVTTDNI